MAEAEQEGSQPRRQERVPASVQVQGQVLPRGCGRGNYPGHYPQTFLPSGIYYNMDTNFFFVCFILLILTT